MIKEIVLAIVCIHTLSSSAQKTVQLGGLQLNLSGPPVCTFQDHNQWVENYFEIKKDTLYTYDIWYTMVGDEKKEVNQVVWEAGALKDIVISRCEIDSNEATDSSCNFSIFLYDDAATGGTSFYRRLYNKEGIKKMNWHGILLIFCNEYSLFDKIKSRITEGRKQ